MYIPYVTSSHEQTGYIIAFAHFEEGYLLENDINLEEDESILASVDESCADDNPDDEYISTDNLEDIWGANYAHLNINVRDARLKIRDHIRQEQNE